MDGVGILDWAGGGYRYRSWEIYWEVVTGLTMTAQRHSTEGRA